MEARQRKEEGEKGRFQKNRGGMRYRGYRLGRVQGKKEGAG